MEFNEDDKTYTIINSLLLTEYEPPMKKKIGLDFKTWCTFQYERLSHLSFQF